MTQQIEAISIITPWGQRFAVGDMWEGEPILYICQTGAIRTEHYLTSAMPPGYILTVKAVKKEKAF